MADYDMCVDYDTLCAIENKLQKIEFDLNNSTQKMVDAINKSQNFLAGNQFEKAKNTTKNCVKISKKTETNIKNAREFICELRNKLEKYGTYIYSEEL